MIDSVYPPLEPSTYLARARPGFPFDRERCRLTHLGRGAVWMGLLGLGLEGGRIAMPAYHCGSEVDAARVAGLEVDFYRVNDDLTVDLDDMREVAARCSALYLISYFGFPVPIDEALECGVPVIEDAAHALFSLDRAGRPIGSLGEAAIFCPRKTLGVPDGGALLASRTLRLEDQRPARVLGRSIASLAVGRAAASRLRFVAAPAARAMERLSRTQRAAEAGEMTEAVIGEWNLTREDLVAAAGRPSPLTAWAVSRANPAEIRARRRENYSVLADAMGDRVPTGFRKLPEGTCPLYLPVSTSGRDSALRALWRNRIRAMEIWPVAHPMLDAARFAELDGVRRSLVALPVHQVVRDVNSLAERADDALRSCE